MTGRLDFGHETAAIAVLRAGFDGRPRPAPKTVRLYLRKGVWGVTDGYGSDTEPYALTHLPTGLRAGGFESQEAAAEVLGRVVDAGFRSWRKHGRFGERPTPDDELREVLQGA